MKLAINVSKTIENFGHVFSDGFKVVSELVQNARRAKASLVSITQFEEDGKSCFRIEDNGQGIADFNALFTLSQSGWSEETQGAELPFGMGFFSVFYVSENVSVQSMGKRIDINCKSAVALEEFGDVIVDDSVLSGTAITLRGVNISQFEQKLKRIADASSVDISFNGSLLPKERSFGVVSTQFPVLSSPFGPFVLAKPFEDSFVVVVQDIIVHEPNLHITAKAKNMLFCDSNKVSVRMPDRDKIINESDFLSEAKSWLSAYYAKLLREIRANMADDVAFMDQHYDDVIKYARELTCEIDYLPQEAFSGVFMPSLGGDTYCMDVGDHGVFRHDDTLIAKEQYSLHDGYSAVVGMFLNQIAALVPERDIPKDHWIWSRAMSFDINDFVVTAVNPVVFEFNGLNYIYKGKAIAADDIHIQHKGLGLTVRAKQAPGAGISHNTFDFYGFGQSDNYCQVEHPLRVIQDENGNKIDMTDIDMVLIKEVGYYNDVVTQVERYIDEWDATLEVEIEEDANLLRQQLVVACGGSMGNVLSEMIGDLPIELSRKLEGKSAVVSFKNGKVHFDFAT